jgi:hypothetical protein
MSSARMAALLSSHRGALCHVSIWDKYELVPEIPHANQIEPAISPKV